MRNALQKSCRENENTHFMFNNFFRKSRRSGDNVGKYGRAREQQMTSQYDMRTARWIS